MNITGISSLNQPESATAIEYGLIAALICVGIIAAATTLGGSLSGLSDNNDGKKVEVSAPATPATK